MLVAGSSWCVVRRVMMAEEGRYRYPVIRLSDIDCPISDTRYVKQEGGRATTPYSFIFHVKQTLPTPRAQWRPRAQGLVDRVDPRLAARSSQLTTPQRPAVRSRVAELAARRADCVLRAEHGTAVQGTTGQQLNRSPSVPGAAQQIANSEYS
jgi:hypothetical protein